jgi:hypothetical protein
MCLYIYNMARYSMNSEDKKISTSTYVPHCLITKSTVLNPFLYKKTHYLYYKYIWWHNTLNLSKKFLEALVYKIVPEAVVLNRLLSQHGGHLL